MIIDCKEFHNVDLEIIQQNLDRIHLYNTNRVHSAALLTHF